MVWLLEESLAGKATLKTLCLKCIKLDMTSLILDLHISIYRIFLNCSYIHKTVSVYINISVNEVNDSFNC